MTHHEEYNPAMRIQFFTSRPRDDSFHVHLDISMPDSSCHTHPSVALALNTTTNHHVQAGLRRNHNSISVNRGSPPAFSLLLISHLHYSRVRAYRVWLNSLQQRMCEPTEHLQNRCCQRAERVNLTVFFKTAERQNAAVSRVAARALGQEDGVVRD